VGGRGRNTEKGACHRTLGVFPPHLATTLNTTSTPPLFSSVRFLSLVKSTLGQVGGPRLRAGHVVGFFWCVNIRFRAEFRFFDCPSLSTPRSVRVPCPLAGSDPGKDFLEATLIVR
jgi:hypothetical protein